MRKYVIETLKENVLEGKLDNKTAKRVATLVEKFGHGTFQGQGFNESECHPCPCRPVEYGVVNVCWDKVFDFNNKRIRTSV